MEDTDFFQFGKDWKKKDKEEDIGGDGYGGKTGREKQPFPEGAKEISIGDRNRNLIYQRRKQTQNCQREQIASGAIHRQEMSGESAAPADNSVSADLRRQNRQQRQTIGIKEGYQKGAENTDQQTVDFAQKIAGKKDQQDGEGGIRYGQKQKRSGIGKRGEYTNKGGIASAQRTTSTLKVSV